jgi:hypothetical protein
MITGGTNVRLGSKLTDPAISDTWQMYPQKLTDSQQHSKQSCFPQTGDTSDRSGHVVRRGQLVDAGPHLLHRPLSAAFERRLRKRLVARRGLAPQGGGARPPRA